MSFAPSRQLQLVVVASLLRAVSPAIVSKTVDAETQGGAMGVSHPYVGLLYHIIDLYLGFQLSTERNQSVVCSDSGPYVFQLSDYCADRSVMGQLSCDDDMYFLHVLSHGSNITVARH